MVKLNGSKTWTERWEVESMTTPGVKYIVARKGDQSFGCNCPAWKFTTEVGVTPAGGRTRTMTGREFNKEFGKEQAKEILAGHLPHITAVSRRVDCKHILSMLESLMTVLAPSRRFLDGVEVTAKRELPAEMITSRRFIDEALPKQSQVVPVQVSLNGEMFRVRRMFLEE